MTKLAYVGRHGAVDVVLPNGGLKTVACGEEFTTTPEHAQSLLEQEDNWKPVPARGKSKAAQAEKEE